MIPPPALRRVDPNAKAVGSGPARPVLVEQVARLDHAFQPAASAARAATARPAGPLQVRAKLAGSIAFNGQIFGGLALVNGGKHYASVFGSVLVLRSVADGTQIHCFDPSPPVPPNTSTLSSVYAPAPHCNPISCIAISSSGRLVAVGGSRSPSDVVIWDVTASPPRVAYRLSHHTAGLRTLDFSPDERFVLTVGDAFDNKLFVYDLLAPGQPGLVTNGTSEGITKVRFGPRLRDRAGNITSQYVVAFAGVDRIELLTFDPVAGRLSSSGRVALGALKRYYNALTWSPEGGLLFAGSSSGDVVVIYAATRVLVQTIPPSASAAGGVGSVTFLQGGAQVLVGRADGSFTTYQRRGDVNEPLLDIAQFKIQGTITSLSHSEASGLAVAGTLEGAIYRIDGLTTSAPRATKLSQAHVAAVNDVAFATDPALRGIFATCSADSSVQIWQVDSLKQLAQGGTIKAATASNTAQAATCVAVASDQVLVGYASGAIRSFAVETGADLWTLPSAHKAVSAIGVASNERYFVSAGSTGESRAWNFQARALLSEGKEHAAPVAALVPYKDGTRWLSVSSDKRLCETDMRAAKLLSLHESKMGAIVGLALAPDEQTIYTLGKDNAISYWRLGSPSPVHLISSVHGPKGDPTCLAQSTNGAMLATGDGSGKIFLWNASTRQLHEVLSNGHTASVRKLAFSPDDRTLLSVGDDGAVLQWKLDGW